MTHFMPFRNTLIAAVLLPALFYLSGCNQQPKQPISSYEQDIISERAEKDSVFQLQQESPIPDSLQAGFSGLSYFPVDETFKVQAILSLNSNPEPFEMMTTTERRPLYVLFGIASFQLEGIEHKLEVFQNIELKASPGYEEHLFIPFRDLTSGKESYGGGRYMDVRIPADSVLILDFNTAYNPYCAYNLKYSCPIPPTNNTLSIAVKAGEKAPANH